MYQEFYGLIAKPFSLTPDPAYFFRSPCHGNALDLIRHAIRQGSGLMTITGTSGLGKTTLCRTILEELGLDGLDRNTFTSLVLNPYLSPEDLLQVVLQDFGVVSRQEASAARLAHVPVNELLRTLHDFLRSLPSLDARAAILVDEAQKLPAPALHQLQRLAMLSERGRPLLQIVLVGQLNLKDTLRTQLSSGVAIRYRLRPLNADETASYVAHRMRVAGERAAGTFTARALHAVHRATGGNPRLVNIICERALQTAFAGGSASIEADVILRAAEGLGLAPTGGSVLGWFRRVAAL
jgi:general secretion pathway protein A